MFVFSFSNVIAINVNNTVYAYIMIIIVANVFFSFLNVIAINVSGTILASIMMIMVAISLP